MAGVKATPELLNWLWDSKFVAVAEDMPALKDCLGVEEKAMDTRQKKRSKMCE
ncbi:MAG: hypothetical protein Q9177_003329 [Variospora cf. flavescens]